MQEMIQHTKRHLYVPLTEMERKEHAEILLQKLTEYDKKEQDAKDSASAFKDELKKIWDGIDQEREALDKGIEQLVGCTEYLDEAQREIITVRNDTGEEVSRRKATEDDFQASLNFEK
jgi:uncharacterized FlaG/YvyC family protein